MLSCRSCWAKGPNVVGSGTQWMLLWLWGNPEKEQKALIWPPPSPWFHTAVFVQMSGKALLYALWITKGPIWTHWQVVTMLWPTEQHRASGRTIPSAKAYLAPDFWSSQGRVQSCFYSLWQKWSKNVSTHTHNPRDLSVYQSTITQRKQNHSDPCSPTSEHSYLHGNCAKVPI